MSKHNKIGVKGEQIAENYLLNKGYIILHRNWRSGRKEIDIIALQDNMLVIVEVKTRTAIAILFPEESVNKKKQEYLKLAGAEFLNANPAYKDMRYDIISIVMEGETATEIVHFEEAF